MSPELKQFLKENKNLLEDRDWETLYYKLRIDYKAEFTELMLNTLNIDPAKELGYIPDNYLAYSKNIKYYKIPNNITSVGNYTFSGCTSLTSVKIGNNVTLIGDYAFRNCYSLTSIEIPDSVTSIGSWAFENCSSLTSITIPNSVTTIGNYALSGCNKLTEIQYGGTKREFLTKLKIKDKSWRQGSAIKKIICNDGEIEL